MLMTADTDPPIDRELHLESFRSYLMLLATRQLPALVRSRLEPQDLVQETLLEALRDTPHRLDRSRPRTAAWLRTILAHNVHNALRDLTRHKRDAERERSLDAAIEQANTAAGSWLDAGEAGPASVMAHHEHLLQLADAVAELPADQRTAVELRYWQEQPLAQIAERMQRSPAAVAGLLHRGIQTLRVHLEPQ